MKKTLGYLDDYFKKRLKPHVQPEYWEDERFNGQNQPVVGVSWIEAEAYCGWLTHRLQNEAAAEWARGMRVLLPTDSQWERAAVGTHGRAYPWGEDKPTLELANFDAKDGVGRPSPVGAYPRGATPEGLLDMGGNVWEWTSNPYDEADEAKAVGEQLPVVMCALRGGSWFYFAVSLRCSLRLGSRAGDRSFGVGFRSVDVGFRCALSVSEHD